MNESLHESAHFLRMLTDFMPGMVGYWTRDLRSTFVNREYLNWFGKDPEEIHGIGIRDLLGDELFYKHEPYIRAALAGEAQSFDYTLTLPNDQIKETLVHYIPHRDSDQVQGLFVLILDITERKSLEQAMIAVAEERQRFIGQELHDNLGQQLAAIAYQARALEHMVSASAGGEAAKVSASIATQAQNAILQCKHLARGLLPLELESNSLTSALQEFAANISDSYRVDCTFECSQGIVIDDQSLALNLFRIAQEAVHNAIDHGGAKRLWIRLSVIESGWGLSVSDDGCGFDGSGLKPNALPGMGIKIMQYRARQIGATLSVLAREGGGTEIRMERPGGWP